MKKYLIVLIFLLALFLRTYRLGERPIGFLWDEAALGYNGYSVLKTGRDEYGKFLPIILKSFGDYKPGLYIYLTVLPIAFFGLNEFSTRLPSAVCGSLSVIMVYFLIQKAAQLFRSGLEEKTDKFALILSGILAINPWNYSFSRGAWEVNVMFLELILGFYFLLFFLVKKKRFSIFVSAIFFLLSLFTYQAAKFLMPVLLAGFVFFFRKEFKQIDLKEKLLFFFFVFSGFFLFNLTTLFSGKAGRIALMSIFSYPRSSQETQRILGEDGGNHLLFSFFHGDCFFFARSVLGRYLNHFSGRFLFFEGDWSNPRNFILYQGLFYPFEAVLFGLGLTRLFVKKKSPFDNFILYWLLVSPLSSALTRDSVSAVRSYNMLFPMIYIIVNGVIFVGEILRRKRKIFRFLVSTALSVLYLGFFIRMWDLYFIHDPLLNAKQRLFGYRQAIQAVNNYGKNRHKIVFTTKYGQPYIFYLFYSKYNPAEYQKQALLREDPYGDVGKIERVDNLEFKEIYWPSERSLSNCLFIGDQFDLPKNDVTSQKGILLLEDINYPNGEVAFRIVETQ